jgi:peptide deformylase
MSDILPILLHPHPLLKQKAAPVAAVDDAVHSTLNAMVATMKAANGVGLAGNQVGLLQRLVVLDMDAITNYMEHYKEDTTGLPTGVVQMINPEVSDISTNMYLHKGEGCLSVPDVYTELERPASCTINYTDEHGAPQAFTAHGLAAAAILHEVDHLNGIMFPDRMSRLKREMLSKKYTKLLDYFIKYPRYRIAVHGVGVREADPSGWKE